MDMLLMYWLPCLCMIGGMVLAARRLMHYFQLESYQFHGYFQTVNRQWRGAIDPYLALSGIYLGVFLLYTFIASILLMSDNHASWTVPQVIWALLCCAGYVLAGWLIRKRVMKRSEKKKFALTARMKRLYGSLIVTLLLIPVLVFLFWGDVHAFGAICCVIAALLLPWIVALAGVLALPIEKLIFHLYFKDAEKKLLENPRLIRIGITGSYGKTSTKFILAEILSQKYNVLATPASFNTPMGVTRIIRERLTPAHQVFIGEMGARHVGEIKELSNLVHPAIGILTAVGPQHLDTFKTIERIEKTKYELIDALPEDGLSVFLNDDGIVARLYEKTGKPKMLAGKEGADACPPRAATSPCT